MRRMGNGQRRILDWDAGNPSEGVREPLSTQVKPRRDRPTGRCGGGKGLGQGATQVRGPRGAVTRGEVGRVKRQADRPTSEGQPSRPGGALRGRATPS